MCVRRKTGKEDPAGKDQPEAKEEVKIDPKMEAICRDLEEKMKVILGTKVAINQKEKPEGQDRN